MLIEESFLRYEDSNGDMDSYTLRNKTCTVKILENLANLGPCSLNIVGGSGPNKGPFIWICLAICVCRMAGRGLGKCQQIIHIGFVELGAGM